MGLFLLKFSGVILVGFGAFGYFIFSQRGSELGYEVNYAPAPDSHGVKFSEVSHQFGIDFIHLKDRKRDDPIKFSPPPTVTVCDLNQDNSFDVVFSGDYKVRLFLNQNGVLVDESHYIEGVLNEYKGILSGIVGCHDFNADGLEDLLITYYHRPHIILFNKGRMRFELDNEALNGYSSRPEGIGIFDFNKDGIWDIVFANFLASDKEEKERESSDHWAAPPKYDNFSGGRNHLLLGYPGPHRATYFRVNSNVDFKTRSYTHSVGLADFDLDGWIDIFFANDYAHDELFFNVNGQYVEDRTNAVLPRYLHGLSGMNSELCDLNQDLLPDLYVTNAFKPPFLTSYNLLWLSTGEPLFFQELSNEVGSARCGFSWGAKCIDVNRDGKEDIFVTNGRNRSRGLKVREEGQSFWYRRSIGSRTPRFLPKDPFVWVRGRGKLLYASAFERDCVFLNIGNKKIEDQKFIDVAVPSGIQDESEGKGLAEVDINNDGRLDVIITNSGSHPFVYLNESTGSDLDWMGFHFRDKAGSSQIPGVTLEIIDFSGKVEKKEVIFNLNGYSAQSDSRLMWALPKKWDMMRMRFKITWPGGNSQIFNASQFVRNRYNLINYGSSRLTWY